MKKLKVGIAGVRGMSTVLGLNNAEDVEIAALCDLCEETLEREKKQVGGNVKTYRVFDDMLESDIDAVVIATPMQCHVPQAIAALEAGKHVLSEVTAGVTIDELWWLCESVEKYKKTYMMAENYIYMEHSQILKQLVQHGILGEPYYAECMYLHNIDGLFVYPNGKTSWRSFWQCGKRGNFYPTHSLGPIMNCLPDDRITEISCFSPGVYNDIGLKQDSGTTTMCRTEKGRLINLRVDCLSPRPHSTAYYHLQGTKGVFQSSTGFTDQNKISIVSDTNPHNDMQWEPLTNYNSYLPDRYKNATEEQKAAGHSGGDFFLVDDFIKAIRTGEEPDINVYKACEWTAVGLLSELSVVNNGRTMQMPHFKKNATLKDKELKL